MLYLQIGLLLLLVELCELPQYQANWQEERRESHGKRRRKQASQEAIRSDGKKRGGEGRLSMDGTMASITYKSKKKFTSK